MEGEIADTYGDRVAAGGRAIVKIGNELSLIHIYPACGKDFRQLYRRIRNQVRLTQLHAVGAGKVALAKYYH